MNRKHIQLENGAILPKTRNLWESAILKLQEADSAISDMTLARDRVDFEEGWSRYVDSIEQFWTRFYDEGKDKFTSFQPWAGKIDSERKSDETLNYVYQSRHKSQHGRIALEWEPPKLIIGRGFSGLEYGLRIFPDGTYEANTVPHNPSSKSFSVDYSPGSPSLPTIEDKRKKKYFSAPSKHLGEILIDNSPLKVARITLTYYKNTLNDGFAKFSPHE